MKPTMNDPQLETASAAGTRAARRARDRLQPSLLDRLTDTAPHQHTEPPDAQWISGERLRSAVLRDLAWLLNSGNAEDRIDAAAFAHARSSVLNYGMRPLAGLRMSGLARADVEASIRDAIARFEPRIAADSLEVRCVGDDGGNAGDARRQHNLLAFEIRGRLWSVPHPVDMVLRSELDLETGAVSLHPTASPKEVPLRDDRS